MFEVGQVILTDVAIVGGGNAGMRAAVASATKGAKTALITKSPFPGGSSIVAGGFHQASFGADDSEDLHFMDTIKGGYYLNNQKLVRILVNGAKDAILDLESFGGAFYRTDSQTYELRALGGYSVPRAVEVGRTDRVQRILHDEANRWSIPVYDETMATRLLTDSEGAVRGVCAFDIRTGRSLVLLAKCVVLATGALGRLFRRTPNTRNATGDGFGLAMNLGTRMVDMEFMQFIPLTYLYPSFIEGMTLGEATIWGPKTKYLNIHGERFIEKYDPVRLEKTTRDIAARANYIEVREGRGTPHGGIWVDTTENDPSEGMYQPHRLRHRWRLVRDFYGIKKANYEEPLEAAPGALFICGGLEIDEGCQTSIEGLFACGEVSGNLHGANRLGGNALIEIQVFGKRAGGMAAEYALNMPQPNADLTQAEEEFARLNTLLTGREGTRPRHIKRELQQTMWDHCAISRNKTGLEEGLDKIKALQEKSASLCLSTDTLRYNYELVEALEVPMMLELAEVMVNAALFRTESRGNHFREDFPQTDNDNWLCHTLIRKADGKLSLSKKEMELTEKDPRAKEKAV